MLALVERIRQLCAFTAGEAGEQGGAEGFVKGALGLRAVADQRGQAGQLIRELADARAELRIRQRIHGGEPREHRARVERHARADRLHGFRDEIAGAVLRGCVGEV